MAEFDIGIFRRQFHVTTSAPEHRGLQTLALSTEQSFPRRPLRGFECDMGDARDLALIIGHFVIAFAQTVLRLALPLVAKIDVAR